MTSPDDNSARPHIRVTKRAPASALAAKARRAFAVARRAAPAGDGIYQLDGMSGRRYRLFIQTLIASLDDARYLEIGVWAGSTFCSAIHNNRVTAVAVDNWSQFGGPRETFLSNLSRFRTPGAEVRLVEADFRRLDYGALGKFNVYFYDGPHSYQDHYDALALADGALDDSFIFIVDDWNWRRVRAGTLDAIRTVGLNATFSAEVRTTLDESYPKLTGKRSDWHNGYFIAALER